MDRTTGVHAWLGLCVLLAIALGGCATSATGDLPVASSEPDDPIPVAMLNTLGSRGTASASAPARRTSIPRGSC